jgi:hypothetical protein
MKSLTVAAVAVFLFAGCGQSTRSGSDAGSGAPVIASFTASPATVSAGGSATLSWSVSGATSLTINNGVGNQTALTTGSAPVTVNATTTFTLSATNATGTTTATTTVTVGSPTTAPTITSFTANPTTVATGGTVLLSWVVVGAVSLSIDSSAVTPVTSGSVTSAVLTQVGTSTFNLTATNGFGSTMASVSVTVTPPPPTITTFTVTPTLATAGAVTFSWNVTGATSLEIGGANVTPASVTPVTSGTGSGTATESVVFALFATNANGTSAANATVTVAGDDAPEFDFTAGSGTTYSGTWGFDVNNVVTPPPGSDTVNSVVITETATNVVSIDTTFDTTGTYTTFTCSGGFTNAVTPNAITGTVGGSGFTCQITDATCGSYTLTATGAFLSGSFDNLISGDPFVIVQNFTSSLSSVTSCNNQQIALVFVLQPS